MRRIFHLVTPQAWKNSGDGPYRADSLASESFIHCSNRDQVVRIANLFFVSQADLLVLTIEVERLTSPIRDEDPGTGELFPHVYGPIDRNAIVEVHPLERGLDGLWVWPDP